MIENKKRSSEGLYGKKKILIQIILSGIAVYFINLQFDQNLQYTLSFLFKETTLYLGFLHTFWHFGCCRFIKCCKPTDGLDGLAIVPVMIASMSFALIAYIIGNLNFSNYLQVSYVPGVGELSVLAGALIGSGLGFLWFNAPPAMVFMEILDHYH